MKSIAMKVAERLSKDTDKIVNLTEYKEIKRAFLGEFARLHNAEDFISSGLDPQHAIYAEAQNMLSFLIETISVLPEFAKHNRIIEQAEEDYMPSWPPMSPVSQTFFFTWIGFDVKVGLAKESYADCVIELGDMLGFDSNMTHLYKLMQQSRLGIYKIVGAIADKLILEELFTKKQYRCQSPNKCPFVLNELWLARLLPPIDDSLDYYVIFTSPYVLKSSEQAWQNFFDRNIKGIRGTDAVEKDYDLFMRDGLGTYYWIEFIMQGYYSHTNLAINLMGIPDIAASRPQSSDNKILPEIKY
jgi:hypothetical protein